ncbi:MAG: hypothetical protein Q3982_07245 [Phoenicibacter congonensis]|uniref:Archaeal ATPase n=1 Tax=Phoenicibacter congonensis TaxID=1944646 RepID=A0AA43RIK4_9ACTN|nr:hypothetical protein [Phoenicibacter congonensis]
MQNPYTLTFGKEPVEYIKRITEEHQIFEDFLSPNPSQQVYMISGVRGCGKTVFMTDVSQELGKDKDWIVVDLNSNKPDLMQEAAAYLSSIQSLAQIFQSAKLNFSLFGFGLEVSNAAPIADIQVALERMIEQLAKHHKKILFTIDEVTVSPQIKSFTFAIQQMLRKNAPVFLLMTGLYQNISDLQNEKNLTFLYRAPKIILSPLNIGAMADNYRRNIKLTPDDAREMARLTKGYSFAFQVVGYFLWKDPGDFTNAIRQSKQYLEEQSYEKIWSELSAKDREVAGAIAKCPSGSIREIKEFLHIEQNELNPYRTRLIRKGIVDGSVRGYLTFSLPFFYDFVLDNL